MNKLTSAQKKAIADRVLKLDPRGGIVTLSPFASWTVVANLPVAPRW